MAEYLIKEESLKAIADAIRGKTGSTDPMTLSQMPEQMEPLADVSTVTARAADVLEGKNIVDAAGNSLEGTIKIYPNPWNIMLGPNAPSTTIPTGYHQYTVVGASMLPEMVVTPSKTAKIVGNEEAGFLSKVTINPIPDEYQDVSGVTAIAEDVLEGKTFVDSNGNKVYGSMPNKTASTTIYAGMSPYTIPEGYHDGTGKVHVPSVVKTVTPTKSKQTVYDDSSTPMLLDYVIVNPIPDKYQDVTNVTATADSVREGQIFVDASGTEQVGTLAVWEGGSY